MTLQPAQDDLGEKQRENVLEITLVDVSLPDGPSPLPLLSPWRPLIPRSCSSPLALAPQVLFGMLDDMVSP